MLDKIKLALQITSSVFDSELTDLIEQAKLDLGFANVVVTDESDGLVARAVTLYCGYQFELLHGSTDKSDKYKTAYDSLKTQMGHSSRYNSIEE